MSSIDYDLQRIRGVAFDVDGVLSPSTIPMNDHGEPVRMVNIKDGYALQLAVRKGVKIAIITGARTEGLVGRYASLGVERVYIGVSRKLPVLKEWMALEGLEPAQVAFVGDDIPDLEAMALAGLAVAPRDAAADVLERARYISPVAGGYGVARDVLEQLLRARGLWLDDADAFGW